MTWSDFYLICFAVGFCFSFFSFIFGGSRFGRLHLPHFHGHGIGHVPVAHGPVAHGPVSGGQAQAAGSAQPGGGAQRGISVSPLNPPVLAAFLAWFGGTGFLLERYYHVWVVLALGAAILSGFGAASVVFWFLARVLVAHETALDDADYDMVGVLGKLSIPIRAGGTGEIIYSQQGTRRVAGARSETGIAIAKGAEVVVTRYEKGIAYVRPWEEMAGDLEMGPEK